MKSIIRQKSNEVWLKYGDKNYKFCHMGLTVQRRKKMILTVMDGHNWIKDDKGISNYFVQ